MTNISIQINLNTAANTSNLKQTFCEKSLIMTSSVDSNAFCWGFLFYKSLQGQYEITLKLSVGCFYNILFSCFEIRN